MPALAFGLAAERVTRAVGRWPFSLRMALPAALALPYIVIAVTEHVFRWQWFAFYAALADPEQRGSWRDALILLALGLAVDLRWLDSAWPAGMRGLNNLLLVDAGLYGFLAIRRLSGTVRSLVLAHINHGWNRAAGGTSEKYGTGAPRCDRDKQSLFGQVSLREPSCPWWLVIGIYASSSGVASSRLRV